MAIRRRTVLHHPRGPRRVNGFHGLGDDPDAALKAATGMYTQPGIASAYPDLASQLTQLYTDKASGMGFLPTGWLQNTLAAFGGPLQSVALPMPTTDVMGRPSAGLPAFLADPTAAQAWEAFRSTIMQAYQAYVAGQADLGRQVLAEAYANSDFWNTLYSIDSVIALPVTATANAITSGANSLASSISTPVWLLGGALLILWLFKR